MSTFILLKSNARHMPAFRDEFHSKILDFEISGQLTMINDVQITITVRMACFFVMSPRGLPIPTHLHFIELSASSKEYVKGISNYCKCTKLSSPSLYMYILSISTVSGSKSATLTLNHILVAHRASELHGFKF